MWCREWLPCTLRGRGKEQGVGCLASVWERRKQVWKRGKRQTVQIHGKDSRVVLECGVAEGEGGGGCIQAGRLHKGRTVDK